MKLLLAVLIFCEFAIPALAEKKKRDFKGLFGSYRREKFTENEANSSDIGFDFMLSTLLPITPVVKSSEDRNTNPTGDPLYYATFFNLEGGAFFTLNYNWEAFVNVGYYGYETRKENTLRNDVTLPLFHQFELSAIPIVAGVKYRFSTEDIVPYVGVGAGMSFVKRKSSYDYDTAGQYISEDNRSAITGMVIAGLEFFFAPRMGIRLEGSAYYLNLPAASFDTQGSPAAFPIIHMQANVWSVRYASGVFFLL